MIAKEGKKEKDKIDKKKKNVLCVDKVDKPIFFG